MKTAFAIAVAGSFTLGWYLYSAKAVLYRQQQMLAEQQQRIHTLMGVLADKSQQEEAVLEARCATQAAKAFREMGFAIRPAQPTDSETLASHFNSRLRTCFMTVETNRQRFGRLFVSRFLFDADDKREYAEYVWMSDAVKDATDIVPLACKEFPLAGVVRLCHSDREYQQMIKPYME